MKRLKKYWEDGIEGGRAHVALYQLAGRSLQYVQPGGSGWFRTAVPRRARCSSLSSSQ